MTHGFIIRDAVAGDEHALCGLVRELAEYERMLDQCAATPERLHAALFGPQPCLEAMLAEVDGHAVAMALYYPIYSSFLAAPGIHLHDLYVQPAHRRLGIGTALLRRLGAICVERGATRLEWIVLDWNELAKTRYRALGAVLEEQWQIMRVDGTAALRQLAEGGRP